MLKTAIPTPGIIMETKCYRDLGSQNITCIVAGPSPEELCLVDSFNKSIKIVSLDSDSPVSSLRLDLVPYRATLVKSSLLAVTSLDRNVTSFIDVTITRKPRMHSKISTGRRYVGIAEGTPYCDCATLLVSCGHDTGGPATVDMMTLSGVWVRTLVTSRILPELKWPWYVHADTPRDMLYLSDCRAQCVFCVQLSTGEVLNRLKHSRMSLPRQVCTDSRGNLYVASAWGECVLQKSLGDVWREVVSGPRHGQGESVCPSSVSVTDAALVVGWGEVVKRYATVLPDGGGGDGTVSHRDWPVRPVGHTALTPAGRVRD